MAYSTEVFFDEQAEDGMHSMPKKMQVSFLKTENNQEWLYRLVYMASETGMIMLNTCCSLCKEKTCNLCNRQYKNKSRNVVPDTNVV